MTSPQITNSRKRKRKRTAGQRRYQSLRRTVDDVRILLRGLQNGMTCADMDGKQLRQLYIMQKVTEAYEALGVREL